MVCMESMLIYQNYLICRPTWICRFLPENIKTRCLNSFNSHITQDIHNIFSNDLLHCYVLIKTNKDYFIQISDCYRYETICGNLAVLIHLI